MTRDEIIALIVDLSNAAGLVPWEMLGGAIAESGLNPRAERLNPKPDRSFGLYQQSSLYAPEGDLSDDEARLRYFDPEHAFDVAARNYRNWRYDPDVSALDAWCRYNWPARDPLRNPNRANYQRGLVEAQRILGAAPMPPTRVTFNKQEPVHTQEHAYDCSQDSLEWAMWSLGRKPDDGWMERTMIADGIMSRDLGLLDGSGASLAGWIVKQWGEFGYLSNSEPVVSFEWVAAEGGHAYPLLLGGHSWGGVGHWVGCWGYDQARDVLLLANPAGDSGVFGGQEMTRAQFSARGPFSAVRIWHSDLLEPAPPPPLPAPPPKPSLAEVRAELGALLDTPDERLALRAMRAALTDLHARMG